MTCSPLVFMYPYLPSFSTAAKPSLKPEASSNLHSTTCSPLVFMYPYLPSFFTVAKPPLKPPTESNLHSIICSPLAFMNPYLPSISFTNNFSFGLFTLSALTVSVFLIVELFVLLAIGLLAAFTTVTFADLFLLVLQIAILKNQAYIILF